MATSDRLDWSASSGIRGRELGRSQSGPRPHAAWSSFLEPYSTQVPTKRHTREGQWLWVLLQLHSPHHLAKLWPAGSLRVGTGPALPEQ